MAFFGPLSEYHILPSTLPAFLVIALTLATVWVAAKGTPINGKRYSAVVTLAVGNGLIFLVQGLWFLIPFLTNATLEATLVPALFLGGRQWWAPLTSMFMHAGFFHIIGNMLFLYFFGVKLEQRIGRKVFVGMYLASGLFAVGVTLVGSLFYSAGTAWLISDPMTPNLGASGAVYGLIGFTITAFPKEKVPMPIPLGIVWILHPVRPIFAALAFIALNLFELVMGSNVAWWAHLAGMLLGALWGVRWRKNGPRVRIDGMTGWGSEGPVSYTYSYRQQR